MSSYLVDVVEPDHEPRRLTIEAPSGGGPASATGSTSTTVGCRAGT